MLMISYLLVLSFKVKFSVDKEFSNVLETSFLLLLVLLLCLDYNLLAAELLVVFFS